MKQSKEKCHGWAMNGLGKRCGRTAQTSEVWKGCPLFSSPVLLFIEKAAGGGGWGGWGGCWCAHLWHLDGMEQAQQYPVRVSHFLSFIPTFTVPFLCVDIFRAVKTYHYVTVAYSIQRSDVPHRFVA